MNIFNEGKEQNIAQALNAKDKRVALQQKIFATIKNRFLEKLFNYGIKQLEASWDKLGFAYKLVVSLDEDTGCENFYILDLPIKKVKQTTIAFEDQAELGRLFDADVLVKDKNAAISRRDLGPSPRKCFICDRPAKECARSRRHSVAEMQDYISELYAKNVK